MPDFVLIDVVDITHKKLQQKQNKTLMIHVLDMKYKEKTENG